MLLRVCSPCQTLRSQLLAELHDKTFRWFPRQEIPFEPLPNGGHGGWLDRYGDYEDIQIQSEEDVYIRVQIGRRADGFMRCNSRHRN